MSNDSPLVSVIVPVYNTADYLSHCLDSLLNQAFEAFEVLVIDDGSTDGSADLADRYARKDSRVRVIRQPNRGVSAARNRGLDAATGRYVTFVDADDWVEAGYFDRLAPAAEAADVLYFGGQQRNRQGNILSTFHLEAADSRHTSLTELIGYLAESDLTGRIWLMWIRRELLEAGSIRFPEGIQLHEDFLFAVRCLLHTRRLVFCPYAPYVYMDYSEQNRPTLSRRLPDNYAEIGLRCLSLYSELLTTAGVPAAKAESWLRKKKEGFYIGSIEVICRTPQLSVGTKLRRIRRLRALFDLKGRIRLFDGAPSKQRLFQAVLNTRCAFLIWGIKWWVLQQK